MSSKLRHHIKLAFQTSPELLNTHNGCNISTLISRLSQQYIEYRFEVKDSLHERVLREARVVIASEPDFQALGITIDDQGNMMLSASNKRGGSERVMSINESISRTYMSSASTAAISSGGAVGTVAIGSKRQRPDDIVGSARSQKHYERMVRGRPRSDSNNSNVSGAGSAPGGMVTSISMQDAIGDGAQEIEDFDLADPGADVDVDLDVAFSSNKKGTRLSTVPESGAATKSGSSTVATNGLQADQEHSAPVAIVRRKNYPKHAKSSNNSAQSKGSTSGTANATSERDNISAMDNAMSAAAAGVPSYLVPTPTERLSDLAGLDAVVSQVKELVFLPLQHPELYSALGVRPPCGILLRGPSGCGKTHLANSIAGELGLPFFRVSGQELIGGTSGESESRIRDVFRAAMSAAPAVLFLDSLDVIAAKGEGSSQRGMERRVISQLIDCIDSVSVMGQAHAPSTVVTPAIAQPPKDSTQSLSEQEGPAAQVVLLCASNKPDGLDPAIRGRFARELALPVPDAPARAAILGILSKNMKLRRQKDVPIPQSAWDPAAVRGDIAGVLGYGGASVSVDCAATAQVPPVDLQALGKLTPGFVGADLRSLAREAGMLAVARLVREHGLLDSIASSALNLKHASSDGISPPNDATGVGAGVAAQPDSEHAESKKSVPINDAAGTLVNDPAASLDEVYVEMSDFVAAAKSIQPSAKREGFAVVPDVTWADLGALAEVREELLHNVLEPIAHPERYKALGLDIPAGVLFFGPPGCGKTLLAKAVANQSGANFISVKGPELLNMYVGESESRVRQVFSRARASTPCVIFFDELDALCPKRGSGDGASGGNGVSERVVNQLLTELDGLEARKDVYIIAATNRLELIDDAMLRPGRLGKLLYVPLPSTSDRVSILSSLTRSVNIVFADGADTNASTANTAHSGVDLSSVARDPRTEGFSGADLSALVREAGLAVMREWREKALAASTTSSNTASEVTSEPPRIFARHFEIALQKVRPSVAKEDRERYSRVHARIREGMGPIQALSLG